MIEELKDKNDPSQFYLDEDNRLLYRAQQREDSEANEAPAISKPRQIQSARTTATQRSTYFNAPQFEQRQTQKSMFLQ